MSKKAVPKIIKKVGFDFHWNEEKVWALKIPVENINISKLEWHFEIPFLNTSKGFYDLTPNQVLNNPGKHKKEYKRTIKANLKHPIDIMPNKGKWLILDGLHRLMKAKLLGIKNVKVRKIPRPMIPKIQF